eukprot:4257442-Pyramimonas_sp.AAC.1
MCSSGTQCVLSTAYEPEESSCSGLVATAKSLVADSRRGAAAVASGRDCEAGSRVREPLLPALLPALCPPFPSLWPRSRS